MSDKNKNEEKDPLAFLPAPIRSMVASSLIKFLKKKNIKSLILVLEEQGNDNWIEDFQLKMYSINILKKLENGK